MPPGRRNEFVTFRDKIDVAITSNSARTTPRDARNAGMVGAVEGDLARGRPEGQVSERHRSLQQVLLARGKMSFAWICVAISLLICCASAAESCGCTASLSGEKKIDGLANLTPLSGRQKIFEEAACQAQKMTEIRVTGGAVKYGTSTPVIEGDHEGCASLRRY